LRGPLYPSPFVLPWKPKPFVRKTPNQRNWGNRPTLHESFLLPVVFLPDLRAVLSGKENPLTEPPVVPNAVPVPYPDVAEGAEVPGPGLLAAINQQPRGIFDYQTNVDRFVILAWLGQAFRNAEVFVPTELATVKPKHLVRLLNSYDLDYRCVDFTDIPNGVKWPPEPPHPRSVVQLGSSFVESTVNFGKSLLVMGTGTGVNDNCGWVRRAFAAGEYRCYGLVRNFSSLKTEAASRLLGAYGDVIFSTTGFKAHSSEAAPSVE
jgi:hypothetical protein